MQRPLPAASHAALRAALTDAAALRRWWDPDADVRGGRLSPGLDGPTLDVDADADGVTWAGEGMRARFDLGAGTVALDAEGLEPADRADLDAGWALALAALGWSLERDGAVRWLRIEVPVALSYGDAWSRITGPEGLAGADGAPLVAVRIAGVRYAARPVLVAAPRAVALVLEEPDALVRLQIGPGESVNAARLDLLVCGDAPLPEDWEPWLARRFGMSWVAQLGEDG